MVQPQPVVPTQRMHKKSRASGVRKIGKKGPIMRSEEVDEHVESCKTKIVLRKIRKRCRGSKRRVKIRKDTKDDRDSIDSDQTHSATRLYNIVNEGDVDDVSNYTVFVHYKHKEAKEKETHIFKPLSPPRTGSSHDDVSHYLYENPAPFLGDVGLPRNTVTITEPIGPNQYGFTIVNLEMHLTPRETLTLGLIPGGNPELTSCISCASKIPSDDLVKHQNFSLTTTPRFSATNITIPELKEKLHDMDWVSQLGYINKDQELVADYNEPFPLDGPRYGRRVPLEHLFNKDLQYLESGNIGMKGNKYALSITKHLTTKYKIWWIEEDIGNLFRKTIVEYDEDVALGIHQKMQNSFIRAKERL
nr:hypothetical protein [Tanacetum cinerariifolium]